MRIVTSLAELDACLAECDRAEAVSDDAMRAVFGTFRMDPPAGLPNDPMSEAYRATQLALYRGIAGRDYAPANEVTAFDIATALRRPFPFSTGSAVTTGDQFMAIGFLIRAMALPPGSRVLEFGPGWGNTTIALAQLGHRVTALDIEPHFCELIRRRAAQVGVAVEVVQGDFFAAGQLGQRFDAILFYECFHHCADHLGLLRLLQRCVVPDGQVIFAGEPITADFPQPWGLRLDGNSLWAIRKNGWLELGFRDDYFRQALAATGWHGRRLACADPGWMHAWIARRHDQPVFRATGADPRLGTQVGRRLGEHILAEDGLAGTVLFGPYLALDAGRYLARIRLAGPGQGQARMDVAAAAGQRILAEAWLAEPPPVLELGFELAAAAEGVEVRIFAERGFTAVIAALEILPA